MRQVFMMIVFLIITFGIWVWLSPFFKEIGSVIEDKKESLRENLDDEYNEEDGF